MDIRAVLNTIEGRIMADIPQIVGLRDQRRMKTDLSFVTEGDLRINAIIAETVLEAFENITIISEEVALSGEEELKGYVVVVDPIDGTENFTSGLPEWGVSVSCFYEGKHIGSLLGCPEMNLWIKTGDNLPRYFSRIRGLSSSLQMDDLVKATQGHEYRILGCCVYNMINAIRGSFLSFENPKGAHSWDILGGLNIALEHNLKVIVNDEEYSGEYLPADKKYRFRVGY
jgi:fructose-1,6-bisphosphatase/inositol monophosphatase family enzyme